MVLRQAPGSRRALRFARPYRQLTIHVDIDVCGLVFRSAEAPFERRPPLTGP